MAFGFAIQIEVLLLRRWKRSRTIFVELSRWPWWSLKNYDEQCSKTLHRWEFIVSKWNAQCLHQKPIFSTWTTQIKFSQKDRWVNEWFCTGRIKVFSSSRIKELNYRTRNNLKSLRAHQACQLKSVVKCTNSSQASRFCESSYVWDTCSRGMPPLQSLQCSEDPWSTFAANERRILLRCD